MTTTTLNHTFLAKIFVNCPEKCQFHNDPSRGYMHFATDIKDLIEEWYVDDDGNKEYEKVATYYVCSDLKNPKCHFASISINVKTNESKKEVYSRIFWILDDELPALNWHLEHLTAFGKESGGRLEDI
tara:strand:+ start:238 stop:621 length:384 start_codon:yes stop_codon:yes gene_type:complete